MRMQNFHLVLLACLALSLGEYALAQQATAPGRKPGSNRWALLIGVDDYMRARKLDYCGADMQALAEQLMAAGFPKDHVYLLHDKAPETKYRPMKANIETHLRLILGLVEKNDLVVVGFSGHGVHMDGKSYLCPTEADLTDPKTLVSLDDVYGRLEKCPAALKLCMVDACRDDPRAGGQKSMRAMEDAKQFAESLQRPPKGILLLTSCAPGEVSREEPEFKHGVFMNYVLEALRGRADSNGNGWVSMMELYLYANDKTKSYVARKFVDSQRPALKGDVNDDFDLVRADVRVEIPRPSSGTPKEITNTIGMKLKLIPAGEFLMGSPESEESRNSDEKQHRVRITKPFYLGVYEVTQSEYEKVMGENPSDSKGATRPVEMVSWNDAVEFCKKLSAKEGRTYRLPTEAEWEYACRAGTTTPFNFGSVLNGKQANCDGDHPYGTETKGPDLGKTTTAGSYAPNTWGLYDMHGNVCEWCGDRYDSDYYEKSPTDDPTGPATGSCRVHRGGSWNYRPRLCRSAFRSRLTPDFRSHYLGFRVALVPSE